MLSVVPAQKLVVLVDGRTNRMLPSTRPVAEATALVRVTAEFVALIAAVKVQSSKMDS